MHVHNQQTWAMWVESDPGPAARPTELGVTIMDCLCKHTLLNAPLIFADKLAAVFGFGVLEPKFTPNSLARPTQVLSRDRDKGGLKSLKSRGG